MPVVVHVNTNKHCVSLSKSM